MGGAVGAYPVAILFICSLVSFVILVCFILPYTAHHFLNVVTDTAAGIDRVRWPTESMVDWMGQSMRLFALLAILLIPAGFLLPVFDPSVLQGTPGLRTVGLVAAWLWFALPIGLLSSMSVGSMFAVLRPALLWDLLRAFPATLVFYVVTAAGFAGALRLWGLALLGGHITLIPLVAIAWTWGLLVYARLIGRLGWSTNQLGDRRPKRPARPAGKLKPSLRKKITVSDPWAEPAPEVKKPQPKPQPKPKAKPVAKPSEEEGDEFGPATPYGLTNDPLCRAPKFDLIEGSPFLDVRSSPSKFPTEEPAPAQPRTFAEDDEGGEIGIAPDDVPPPDAKPRLDVEPSRIDMRMMREDEAKPPAFPMFSGVYNFPFYLSSLRSFVVLSLCWIVLGGWIEVLIILFPFK
jgi:hypothetical protein